jgi:hypothetical protein
MVKSGGPGTGAGTFGGFDMKNAKSLRALAIAIEYHLAGGTDRSNLAFSCLSPLQQGTVDMLFQRMKHSPLLTEIVTPFLVTDRKVKADLIAAGQDLEAYAVDATFEPATNSYQEALLAWKNKQPMGFPVIDEEIQAANTLYMAQQQAKLLADRVASAKGGIESDVSLPNSLSRQEHPQSLSFLLFHIIALHHRSPSCKSLTFSSQTDNTDTDDDLEAIHQAKLKCVEQKKQKQKGGKIGSKAQKMDNQDTDETFQRPRNTRPKNSHLAQASAEASKTYVTPPPGPRRSIRNEQNTGSAQKIKNAPKRPIGHRPIAVGVDRTPTVIGTVDRSKLTITFDTERNDPKNKGQVIAGVRVSYQYLENNPEPDVNNVEDIRAINSWRRKIFGRNFPPLRKARELWLQSEKDLVLDLMCRQFERHKYLRWNLLANDYNRQMALSDVVQHAGEHYVKSSGRLDGLKEDRVAPWRTKQAIMGQATSRWSEYQDLIEAFQPTLNDEENGGEIVAMKMTLITLRTLVMRRRFPTQAPNQDPQSPAEELRSLRMLARLLRLVLKVLLAAVESEHTRR